MSDLMDLTPQRDTIKTELVHPTTQEPLEHEGQPMWVERYLPHTPEYKKSQYSRTQKYLKSAQSKGKADVDIDLYEAEQDHIEVMAETTVAWNIYFGGEWLKFTPKKAKEVYGKAFWILDQLQEDENSAEVFTKV